VGHAESETTREAMVDALRDGVKYSNGNRALKHLGVPAVTVPMGMLTDKQMPIGLTFAGKGWSDNDLLRYAYAYERATKHRVNPPNAPALDCAIVKLESAKLQSSSRLRLILERKVVNRSSDNQFDIREIELSGTVKHGNTSAVVNEIRIYTNDATCASVEVRNDRWKWKAALKRPWVQELYPIPIKVPRDQFLIIIRAKASTGHSAGLLLIED
jgi:hypothetical protein